MQRVPHVKEIDKNFQAYFFPQAYLFNKSTAIIHI